MVVAALANRAVAISAARVAESAPAGVAEGAGRMPSTESISTDLEILRVSHQVEADQVAALSARRAARDEAAVRRGLDGLTAAVREGRNAIPAMLDAVRAEATLGEICGLLRTLWGEYREPAQF